MEAVTGQPIQNFNFFEFSRVSPGDQPLAKELEDSEIKLQAVPFWIVERSREIAEPKQLERTSGGALGKRQEKGERKSK